MEMDVQIPVNFKLAIDAALSLHNAYLSIPLSLVYVEMEWKIQINNVMMAIVIQVMDAHKIVQ